MQIPNLFGGTSPAYLASLKEPARVIAASMPDGAFPDVTALGRSLGISVVAAIDAVALAHVIRAEAARRVDG